MIVCVEEENNNVTLVTVSNASDSEKIKYMRFINLKSYGNICDGKNIKISVSFQLEAYNLVSQNFLLLHRFQVFL